jgi:ABC-type multidrug transport system permease subunit
MTVLLMPLWLLSGAFFPTEGVPIWLALLMRFDPLTYGVAAFRYTLSFGTGAAPVGLPHFALSIGITVAFAAACFAAAVYLARRRAAASGP